MSHEWQFGGVRLNSNNLPQIHKIEIMLIVLAYVIVIVLGQFAFTLGTFIGGLLTLPFNLALDAVFSDNLRATSIRSAVVHFIVGICGSSACVAFSWLMFYLLVGANSFGFFPFLAAIGSMVFPIYNDFSKHREMQKLRSDTEQEMGTETFKAVSEVTAPMTNAFGVVVVGEITGIVLSGFVSFFI